MRSIKDIEKLVKRFHTEPGLGMKSNVLNEAMRIQKKQNPAKISTVCTLKNIAGSRLAKLTASVSFLVIIFSVIGFFDLLTKPAYAIEQTIRANNKIQTFHFKLYLNNNELHREAWVEYDNDRNISKVRINYYDDNQKESLVQIWKANEAIQWNTDTDRILIIEDKSFSDKILRFGEKYNPRALIQYLYERKEQDNITIEIKESQDKTEPIIITADYPPNTYLLGADKPAMRDVYFIDPVTKLITSVEIYQLKDDKYYHLAIWQYEDYDQPFDDALFSIEY